MGALWPAGRPAAAGVVVSRRSFEFGVIRERESRHLFSHFRSSTMAAVGIFLTFSKKILLLLQILNLTSLSYTAHTSQNSTYRHIRHRDFLLLLPAQK